MALNKKPSAPKAEPAGATKQAAAATEENRNADQPEVAVDEQGKAINTGDQNAAPGTPAQPQSRDAAENQEGVEKPEGGEGGDQSEGNGEGDETPPVQDTLSGLPQSREADENSEEAARLAAEKEAAEQAEREEEARKAAAQKVLDDRKAEEEAVAQADKALKDAAKGKTKAKAKDSMVKVKNISSLPQRQWSTGIWIEPGATESVKEDGWYRANRDAKIIEDAE